MNLERHLLAELVFARMMQAVDICALLELEAELRGTAGDLEAGPATDELINQLLEHAWRRLERNWRGLPDEGDGAGGAYRVIDDPARGQIIEVDLAGCRGEAAPSTRRRGRPR